MPLAAAWMGLEMITKWSKSERQISYDIAYMWNLNYNTTEHIYKIKQTDSFKHKLTVTKGEKGGGGMN